MKIPFGKTTKNALSQKKYTKNLLKKADAEQHKYTGLSEKQVAQLFPEGN